MRSRSGRRYSAGGWSTAPSAIRPASCTSGTTPAISTPAPRTSSPPSHDHPVRLRHRPQPAPRAHPAGRKAPAARDRAGRPAQRRAFRRGVPPHQPSLHGAGAGDRRGRGADRQRGHRGLCGGPAARTAAAGPHAAGQGRDRQLAVAGGVRGADGRGRGIAQQQPGDGGPRPAGAGELCADPGPGRARCAAAQALPRRAEHSSRRPRVHRGGPVQHRRHHGRRGGGFRPGRQGPAGRRASAPAALARGDGGTRHDGLSRAPLSARARPASGARRRARCSRC
mmetsp:Transcript_1028/g.2628  ORF Transcript_1028/g.2628 Transcript_1028/m.2628 type:complete len:281 (+) Transcript_1028:1137-1979(+)